MKVVDMRRATRLLAIAVWAAVLPLLWSCSEADDTVNEYADWQRRNDTFVFSLADSLWQPSSQGQWLRFKSFSKDETTEGMAADYIYAKVLEQGSGTTSPLYTDTVRVSYIGRLMPVASVPEGAVFDKTFTGQFSWQTTGVIDAVVSGFVDGFTTAMLHMHRGDRWRVYIPYQLGYGSRTSGSVPAYSTLIFDVALVDYCPPGETMPKWNARKR